MQYPKSPIGDYKRFWIEDLGFRIEGLGLQLLREVA